MRRQNLVAWDGVHHLQHTAEDDPQAHVGQVQKAVCAPSGLAWVLGPYPFQPPVQETHQHKPADSLDELKEFAAHGVLQFVATAVDLTVSGGTRNNFPDSVTAFLSSPWWTVFSTIYASPPGAFGGSNE